MNMGYRCLYMNIYINEYLNTKTKLIFIYLKSHFICDFFIYGEHEVFIK